MLFVIACAYHRNILELNQEFYDHQCYVCKLRQSIKVGCEINNWFHCEKLIESGVNWIKRKTTKYLLLPDSCLCRKCSSKLHAVAQLVDIYWPGSSAKLISAAILPSLLSCIDKNPSLK